MTRAKQIQNTKRTKVIIETKKKNDEVLIEVEWIWLFEEFQMVLSSTGRES